jgi:phosphate transport system permease protein
MKKRNTALETGFKWLCLAAIVVPLVLLFVLLAGVFYTGFSRIDWDFLTSFPSRRASSAGIFAGITGSVYLIGLAVMFSLPLGIGAAIYLEEYADRTNRWQNRLAQIIEINIGNLAGVPTVIYGLLGLEVFARAMDFGRSLIAGALTLSLLMLPMVIMTAREALRTVPRVMREAGLALGATKWQTLRRIILPMALPGMVTGAILAVARAIGEAAPLVVLGAVTFITFTPDSLTSSFTALPIQIYNWISRPQTDFHVNAAAGIVVLVTTIGVFNLFANVIRSKYERKLAR